VKSSRPFPIRSLPSPRCLAPSGGELPDVVLGQRVGVDVVATVLMTTLYLVLAARRFASSAGYGSSVAVLHGESQLTCTSLIRIHLFLLPFHRYSLTDELVRLSGFICSEKVAVGLVLRGCLVRPFVGVTLSTVGSVVSVKVAVVDLLAE
jgi:hypothetical protein